MTVPLYLCHKAPPLTQHQPGVTQSLQLVRAASHVRSLLCLLLLAHYPSKGGPNSYKAQFMHVDVHIIRTAGWSVDLVSLKPSQLTLLRLSNRSGIPGISCTPGERASERMQAFMYTTGNEW